MADEDRPASAEAGVEQLRTDLTKLTAQVGALGGEVRALRGDLANTMLTVRLNQVLGPLLLLVVGALTPLIGLQGGDDDRIFTYLDAMWFYHRSSDRAIGDSADALRAAGGYTTTWVALILLTIALAGCGLTCWLLLVDRPSLGQIVAVTTSGGLVLFSLVLLFAGQSAMSYLDPVGPFIGYWLLGAGAVWLLHGAWDANGRRPQRTPAGNRRRP